MFKKWTKHGLRRSNSAAGSGISAVASLRRFSSSSSGGGSSAVPDQVAAPAEGASVAGYADALGPWSQEERAAYIAEFDLRGLANEACVRTFLLDIIGTLPMPPGWFVARDQERRPYFCQSGTGRAEWFHPLHLLVRDLAQEVSELLLLSSKGQDEHVRSLVHKYTAEAGVELTRWQCVSGEDGQQYFISRETQETTKEEPLSLVTGRFQLDAIRRLADAGYREQLQQSGSPVSGSTPQDSPYAQAEAHVAAARGIEGNAGASGSRSGSRRPSTAGEATSESAGAGGHLQVPLQDSPTISSSPSTSPGESGGSELPMSRIASSERAAWTPTEKKAYLASLPRYPGEDNVRRLLEDALTDVPLPRPWVMARHKRDQPFFSNESTGESSKRHPLDQVIVELIKTCHDILNSPDREAMLRGLHASWTQEFARTLMKWVAAHAEHGHACYYHQETGQVIHEDPAGLAWPEFQFRLYVVSRLVEEECYAAASANCPLQAEMDAWQAASSVRALIEAGGSPALQPGLSAADAAQGAVDRVRTSDSAQEKAPARPATPTRKRRGSGLLAMAGGAVASAKETVASLLRPSSPKGVGSLLGFAGWSPEPKAAAGDGSVGEPVEVVADVGFGSQEQEHETWTVEERRLYVDALDLSPPFEAAVRHFLEDVFGEVPLPEPWVLTRSRNHESFFYNELTGVSSWNHPLEAEFLAIADLCRQCLALGRTEGSQQLVEEVLQEKKNEWDAEFQEQLGKWETADSNGRPYYYHRETRESTYEDPGSIVAKNFQWKVNVAYWLQDSEYFERLQAAQLQAEEESSAAEHEDRHAHPPEEAKALALGAASSSAQGSPTQSGLAPSPGAASSSSSTGSPTGRQVLGELQDGWSLSQRRTWLTATGKLKLPAEEVLLELLANAMGIPPLPWPWSLARASRGGSALFVHGFTQRRTSRHPLESALFRLLPVCRELLALPPDRRELRLKQLADEWEAEAKAKLDKWVPSVDEQGKHYYEHCETQEKMFKEPRDVEWPAYQLRLDVLERLRTAPQVHPPASAAKPSSSTRPGASDSLRPPPLTEMGTTSAGEPNMPSPAGSANGAAGNSKDEWTSDERRRYVESLKVLKLPEEEPLLHILEDVLGNAALPAPWVFCRRSGRPFFGIKSTRQTSWKHPLEKTLVEMVPVLREHLQLPEQQRAPRVATLRAEWEAESELKHWVRAVDEKGKRFYYHKETKAHMQEEPQDVLGPAHRLRLDALARLVGEEESSTEESSTVHEVVSTPSNAGSVSLTGALVREEEGDPLSRPSSASSTKIVRSMSISSLRNVEEADRELGQRARSVTPSCLLQPALDEQAYAAQLGLRLDKQGGNDRAVFGLLAPALALGLPVPWKIKSTEHGALFVQPGYEPPLESKEHPMQPLHLELIQVLTSLCSTGAARPTATEAAMQLGGFLDRAIYAGRHSSWVRVMREAEGGDGQPLYEEPKTGHRRRDDPRLAVTSRMGLELLTLKEVWKHAVEMGRDGAEAFPLSDDEAWLIAGQLGASVLRELYPAEAGSLRPSAAIACTTGPEASLEAAVVTEQQSGGGKSPKALGSLRHCQAQLGPLSASTAAPYGSCRTEPSTAAQSWRSGSEACEGAGNAGLQPHLPLPLPLPLPEEESSRSATAASPASPEPGLATHPTSEPAAADATGVVPTFGTPAPATEVSPDEGAAVPTDDAGHDTTHFFGRAEDSAAKEVDCLGTKAKLLTWGRSTGLALASQAELQDYARQFGLKVGEKNTSSGVDQEILSVVAPGLLLELPVPWEVKRSSEGQISFVNPGFRPVLQQKEHPLQALHGEIIQVFRGVASIRHRVSAGDICPRLARLVRNAAGLSSLSSFGTWEVGDNGLYVDKASGLRRWDDPCIAAASQVGQSLVTIQVAWDKLASTSPEGVEPFPFVESEVWVIAGEVAKSVLLGPTAKEEQQQMIPPKETPAHAQPPSSASPAAVLVPAAAAPAPALPQEPPTDEAQEHGGGHEHADLSAADVSAADARVEEAPVHPDTKLFCDYDEEREDEEEEEDPREEDSPSSYLDDLAGAQAPADAARPPEELNDHREEPQLQPTQQPNSEAQERPPSETIEVVPCVREGPPPTAEAAQYPAAPPAPLPPQPQLPLPQVTHQPLPPAQKPAAFHLIDVVCAMGGPQQEPPRSAGPEPPHRPPPPPPSAGYLGHQTTAPRPPPVEQPAAPLDPPPALLPPQIAEEVPSPSTAASSPRQDVPELLAVAAAFVQSAREPEQVTLQDSMWSISADSPTAPVRTAEASPAAAAWPTLASPCLEGPLDVSSCQDSKLSPLARLASGELAEEDPHPSISGWPTTASPSREGPLDAPPSPASRLSPLARLASGDLTMEELSPPPRPSSPQVSVVPPALQESPAAATPPQASATSAISSCSGFAGMAQELLLSPLTSGSLQSPAVSPTPQEQRNVPSFASSPVHSPTRSTCSFSVSGAREMCMEPSLVHDTVHAWPGRLGCKEGGKEPHVDSAEDSTVEPHTFLEPSTVTWPGCESFREEGSGEAVGDELQLVVAAAADLPAIEDVDDHEDALEDLVMDRYLHTRVCPARGSRRPNSAVPIPSLYVAAAQRSCPSAVGEVPASWQQYELTSDGPPQEVDAGRRPVVCHDRSSQTSARCWEAATRSEMAVQTSFREVAPMMVEVATSVQMSNGGPGSPLRPMPPKRPCPRPAPPLLEPVALEVMGEVLPAADLPPQGHDAVPAQAPLTPPPGPLLREVPAVAPAIWQPPQVHVEEVPTSVPAVRHPPPADDFLSCVARLNEDLDATQDSIKAMAEAEWDMEVGDNLLYEVAQVESQPVDEDAQRPASVKSSSSDTSSSANEEEAEGEEESSFLEGILRIRREMEATMRHLEDLQPHLEDVVQEPEEPPLVHAESEEPSSCSESPQKEPWPNPELRMDAPSPRTPREQDEPAVILRTPELATETLGGCQAQLQHQPQLAPLTEHRLVPGQHPHVPLRSPGRSPTMNSSEVLSSPLGNGDVKLFREIVQPSNVSEDLDFTTSDACSPCPVREVLNVAHADSYTGLSRSPSDLDMPRLEHFEVSPPRALSKEFDLLRFGSPPRGKVKDSPSGWLQGAAVAKDDLVKAIVLAGNIKLLREQGETLKRKTSTVEARTNALSRFHKGNKLLNLKIAHPEDAELLETRAALVVRERLRNTRGQLVSLKGALKQELLQLSEDLNEAVERRAQLSNSSAC